MPDGRQDKTFPDAELVATLRRELACAFRWTARLDMHEGVANHFSAAVSDDGKQFLMNPCGVHFSRMKASDLMLLHADDDGVMDLPNAPDPTAWALHGAIHRRVPRARCVVHAHPAYTTALSTLEDPTMLPIDQNTMRFFERVDIDQGFDGLGLGDEAERCAAAVSDNPVLLLGSHGVMTFGPTVADAFDTLYYFERAARTQMLALATGRPLNIASDAVARKTAEQWETYPDLAGRHFRALLDILDEEEPDYRD